MNFLVNKLLFLSFLVCHSLAFSQYTKKIDSLLKRSESKELSTVEQIQTFKNIALYHHDLYIALKYAKKSMQLAKEIKKPILQAEALEEISNLEHKLGNNKQSFSASLQALQIYESLNAIDKIGATYSQLANNSLSYKDYKKGITYLKKSKNVYSKNIYSTHHISVVHNLAEAYRLFGKLDSAAYWFTETLRLNKVLKNDFIEGYTQGNIGMVYSTQNELTSAKEKLTKSIEILTPLNDLYATSVYIAELGEVHRKEKKWDEAETKFLEALTIANREGLKEQIRDFSALLSKFYESQQKYKQALKYNKIYQVYQDSLLNKENIQEIEQLKTNYEIEKRESEIGLLNSMNKKQKIWVIILFIVTSIVLVFAYLLTKANKKIRKVNRTLSKQKSIITKREQEKALLLKELNHRIKNNLQMISSLLNLQSRELSGHSKEALLSGRHRVDALSLVHRKLYQEDHNTRIILKDYIEELVLGLFHGYGATFNPILKIEKISVNIDMAIPIALIINELTINSLKYAYKNIEHPVLQLTIQQKKDLLDVQIIDNGIGFEKGNTQKDSFGIKLIFSLIEQLEGTIKKVKSNCGTHWEMNMKIV
ncbi:tetratricopeptide repeat-containing sensor histidine kinase [Aquimarina pacifica]|uniref:tetratricopeptide repeat-containing sensor histidine kinase n=1 Tax=Aquimarina pacifica TaxID=1296415 RepID=UPI000471B33D|nr:histidine kinase dimerization/phosphoacceptor domain -containing protein [Aquimarina pacifica]